MRRLDCLYRSQTPTLKSDCSEQVASWNVHGPASCPSLSPSSFRSLCSDVPFPGGAAAGRGAPSLSLKLHSPFYPWLNPLSLSATCFPLPFLPPDVPSILLVDLSIICPLPPSCEPHSAGIFTCLVCCCTPSTSS